MHKVLAHEAPGYPGVQVLCHKGTVDEIMASHRDIKKLPTLRGKSVVTLFYEPSTRTRTSFELGPV